MSANTPILITGCQRSGTTLLSLVLDSHPDIYAIDEDYFKDECFNEYLSDPKYHPNVLFKLPTYAHAVKAIKAVPSMKVLWCVRDPRDVAVSMINLRLPINGSLISWAAAPGGADKEIMNCGSALQDYMNDELRELLHRYDGIRKLPPNHRSHATKVYTAALCWRLKQELTEIYNEEGIDYKIVIYEKLITNPKHEIAEILSFLGVSWNDDVLRHDQLHKGVSIGNTDNKRPIDAGNKGKWRKALKNNDIGMISSMCSKLAKKFGYAL